MRDLTVAVLRGSSPRLHEAVNEINWRWALAGEQQALSWRSWFAETGQAEPAQEPSGYDPGALEEARQFLATQTLIHELWVLQQANVAPADLFAGPDTVQRVREVLRREYDRAEHHYAADGEVLREPDVLGDAAQHLAYWSELALFGRGDRLVEDQLRLAGGMTQDLLDDRQILLREALAQLRGPWSLEAHLATPVGKQYLEPQPPWGQVDRIQLTSLDTALGRPKRAVSTAELDQAHADFAAALWEECQRVIRDDPPQPIDPLDPPYDTPARRQRLLETMHGTNDFLASAAGLATLASDRTVRVDGRPVPREQVPWVLGLHQDSVRYLNGYAGVISVAGLRITFRSEKTIGAVAVVDAAGVRKELDPDSLAMTLALLDQPQALTYLAKSKVGLEQAMKTNPAGSATGQRTSDQRGLGERPGTAGSRHATTHRPDSQQRRTH